MALRNAVRDNKVSHAYLFSGPRGTGKTSAARILAKALNCENPVEGEPDDSCDACQRITAGSSMDVHELDAASNNGVDAMRDLVSRAALGTPGRWKVYIVDEVHMLSTAASNALLKTLEEPPSHVVFVLATTDPQKVLPTIRSRTQHYEFRLLGPELLAQLVGDINQRANLNVPQEAIDLVVRRGKGSARDALSTLDQVAAAGGVEDEAELIDEIIESLCERDTGRALVAVAESCNSGREPQRLAVDLLEQLRNGFLTMMSKGLVPLSDTAAQRVEAQARRLGAPALVRAMEMLGEALLQMRDAPDTRVTLEVALARLSKPELSTDVASLLQRIERLEQGAPSQQAPASPPKSAAQPANDQAPAQPQAPVAGSAPQHQAPGKQPHAPAQAPQTKSAQAGGEPQPGGKAQGQAPEQGQSAPRPGARPALGGIKRSAPKAETAPSTTQAPQSQPKSETQAQAPAQPAGEFPDRDKLTEAWGDSILDNLPARARSRFRTGRFVEVDGGRATFALPNSIHRDRCEEVRNEVEMVLRSHFGVRVPLHLIVEADEPPAQEHDEAEEEIVDLSETTDGGAVESMSPEERLLKAFPGAEKVD